MPISRKIFDQDEERIAVIIEKLRHGIFRDDLENLYSVDELSKKYPRFTKTDVALAVQRMKEKEGTLISKVWGGIEYFGHKYV